MNISYNLLIFSINSSLVFFVGCSTTKALKHSSYKVKFIDEYILPNGYNYQNETFGGISGIIYKNGGLIMVNDSPSNPLIFSAEFNLDSFKLAVMVEIRCQKRALNFKTIDL